MRLSEFYLPEDYVDDYIDRQYRDSLSGNHKSMTELTKRPTVGNWPPTAQELREIERAIFQDPEWLAYYARFGWTSFTQIRDTQWEWDTGKQAIVFREVPTISYMPKAMKKHKGWKHPEGGLTSPDRTTVYVGLDGKITKFKSDYSHLAVILPTVVDQIKRFVAQKAPAIRANLPYLQGRYYIRFGKWPENERSQIFRQGWADVEPQFEKGVSAYHAYFDVHEGRWAIDEAFDYDTITGTLTSLYYGSREIYLVQGDEIKATGSDDEPLLHNVRIVKQLDKRDVYMPGVMDHREDEDDA